MLSWCAIQLYFPNSAETHRSISEAAEEIRKYITSCSLISDSAWKSFCSELKYRVTNLFWNMSSMICDPASYCKSSCEKVWWLSVFSLCSEAKQSGTELGTVEAENVISVLPKVRILFLYLSVYKMNSLYMFIPIWTSN